MNQQYLVLYALSVCIYSVDIEPKNTLIQITISAD